MKDPQYPSVLTEDQVRRIISRAVELDQGSALMTRDLSAIAAEAGISQEALRAAMAEVLGGAQVQQSARSDSKRPSWRERGVGLLRAYVIGGSSFAFGSATWLVGGPNSSDIIAIMGACLGVLGAFKISLDNRRSGSQERFQIENLILWLAGAAGWTVASGLITEDVFAVLTLPWGISAILGGLVTSLRKPHLERIIQLIEAKTSARTDKSEAAR